MAAVLLGFTLTTPGDWLWFNQFEVRFDVDPTTDAPVFVGVAPRGDAAAYLADVAHAEVARLGIRTDDVTYGKVPGSRASSAPAPQGFWEASAAGAGSQTMTWLIAPGTWAIVVMNADATPGVAVPGRRRRTPRPNSSNGEDRRERPGPRRPPAPTRSYVRCWRGAGWIPSPPRGWRYPRALSVTWFR